MRDGFVAVAASGLMATSGGAAEAAARAADLDPALRDSLISLSENAHDAGDAWREGADQREQTAGDVAGAYEEPEVVEPREDADLATDSWERADTWESTVDSEDSGVLEAVDAADPGERDA